MGPRPARIHPHNVPPHQHDSNKQGTNVWVICSLSCENIWTAELTKLDHSPCCLAEWQKKFEWTLPACTHHYFHFPVCAHAARERSRNESSWPDGPGQHSSHPPTHLQFLALGNIRTELRRWEWTGPQKETRVIDTSMRHPESPLNFQTLNPRPHRDEKQELCSSPATCSLP